jgi:predicted nucleotidyltransferase
MLTFENILLENRPSIIFESVVGSQAYGTSLPESDEDIKGIFAVSAGEYLNLESPPSQLSDEKGDKVYYSIRRFLELAATANPNIIELLFMPPDCIRYKSRSVA